MSWTCSSTPAGRPGRIWFRRKSTSLPGISTWLELMNRKSPAASPAKGAVPQEGTGVAIIRAPVFAISARGAGIDGGELGCEAAIGDRLGEEAGRMAGAHLDDARGACARARDHRRWRRPAAETSPGPSAPAAGVAAGDGGRRGAGPSPARRRRSRARARDIRAGRRQLAGMAIGNEIAAGLQAQQRREAQRQAPAIDAPAIRLAQGVSVMPSRATRLPGRALASASAWRSMNASLWLGSWWKATKVFTPAASASFSPCAQVEWPQPA